MNPENNDLRDLDKTLNYRRFKKTKGGVINPIIQKIEKPVYEELNKRQEENLILRGKTMSKFQGFIQTRDFPDYVLKPFFYIKRVKIEKTENDKLKSKEKKWNESTNIYSLKKSLNKSQKKLTEEICKKNSFSSIYSVKMEKLLYSVFDEIKMEISKKENFEKDFYKNVVNHFYFIIFEFSDFCNLPKLNVKDFLHAPDKVKAHSIFSKIKSQNLNPILITRERFLNFFQKNFNQINKTFLSEIFDYYADVDNCDYLKTKKLCLYAFGHNFEIYVNSLNPLSQIFSNKKIHFLKNQLSLYLRENNVKNLLYLNFNFNNKNLLFNFFAEEFSFDEKIFKLNLEKIKKGIKKKKWIEYFYFLKENFCSLVVNKKSMGYIFFCQYFNNLLDDLVLDLKSKKTVVEFLDAIDRNNFDTNFVLKQLKIFINKKITDLEQNGLLINNFIKFTLKFDQTAFSQMELDFFQNNLDSENSLIFETLLNKFKGFSKKRFFSEDEKKSEKNVGREKVYLFSKQNEFDIIMENNYVFEEKKTFYNSERFLSNKCQNKENLKNGYKEVNFEKVFEIQNKKSLKDKPDNQNDKNIFSLKVLEEFFENNSEKVRFQINSLLYFFKTVIKFKNSHKEGIAKANENINKKINDNLFFKFVLDLFNFNDNVIEEKIVKIIHLHNKYNNIFLKQNKFFFLKELVFVEENLLTPKNILEEKIEINLKKFENFNTSDFNEKGEIFSKEEKKKDFSEMLLDFENFKNSVKNNFDKDFEIMANKQKILEEEKDTVDLEKGYFQNVKQETDFILKNPWVQNHQHSLHNLFTPSIFKNQNLNQQIKQKNLSKTNNQFFQKIINNKKNYLDVGIEKQEINNNHFFKKKDLKFIENVENFENALKNEILDNKLNFKEGRENELYLNMLKKIRDEYEGLEIMKKVNNPNEVLFTAYDSILEILKKEENELIKLKKFENNY